jgi:hypothetical protein
MWHSPGSPSHADLARDGVEALLPVQCFVFDPRPSAQIRGKVFLLSSGLSWVPPSPVFHTFIETKGVNTLRPKRGAWVAQRPPSKCHFCKKPAEPKARTLLYCQRPCSCSSSEELAHDSAKRKKFKRQKMSVSSHFAPAMHIWDSPVPSITMHMWHSRPPAVRGFWV